jgi:hypothetical protein
MYKIDTASNSIIPIIPLTRPTLGNLGFKEVDNLQEWIAKEPSCLGEQLLVVQKEFADFSYTRERLDLLRGQGHRSGIPSFRERPKFEAFSPS